MQRQPAPPVSNATYSRDTHRKAQTAAPRPPDSTAPSLPPETLPSHRSSPAPRAPDRQQSRASAPPCPQSHAAAAQSHPCAGKYSTHPESRESPPRPPPPAPRYRTHLAPDSPRQSGRTPASSHESPTASPAAPTPSVPAPVPKPLQSAP